MARHRITLKSCPRRTCIPLSGRPLRTHTSLPDRSRPIHTPLMTHPRRLLHGQQHPLPLIFVRKTLMPCIKTLSLDHALIRQLVVFFYQLKKFLQLAFSQRIA